MLIFLLFFCSQLFVFFSNSGLITCNAPTGSPTSVRLQIINRGAVRGESGHCYFTDGGGPNSGQWESTSSNAKVLFQGGSGFESTSIANNSYHYMY